MQEIKINHTTKWYMHKLESAPENVMRHIFLRYKRIAQL